MPETAAICVGDVVDLQHSPNVIFRFCTVAMVGLCPTRGLVAWLELRTHPGCVVAKQSDLIPRHWVECVKCFGEGMDDGKEPAEPRRCYECGGMKGEWVL